MTHHGLTRKCAYFIEVLAWTKGRMPQWCAFLVWPGDHKGPYEAPVHFACTQCRTFFFHRHLLIPSWWGVGEPTGEVWRDGVASQETSNANDGQALQCPAMCLHWFADLPNHAMQPDMHAMHGHNRRDHNRPVTPQARCHHTGTRATDLQLCS